MASTVIAHADVVALSYAEVAAAPADAALHARLAAAFGYDGPGLLVVTGVPGYAEARAAALPFARAFATLPEPVRAAYERPESLHAFGWSHGKERLEAGAFDTLKGSYYANPTTDAPVATPEERAAYPATLSPNVWPAEADVPGFEAAFKRLARLVVATGGLLARHVDAYVAGELGAPAPTALARVVADGDTHKARLLYYFPAADGAGDAGADVSVSSACGWHNDHGSLTGLTAAMYWDADGAEVPCPDPRAGLYVRSRRGELLRVSIPPGALAFQIGEAAQVHSGGVVQATPHCVRAPAGAPGVSRGTMPVFMQPGAREPMALPGGATEERVLRGARGELLPRGVAPLVRRWTGAGQTFGDFAEASMRAYA